MATTQRSEYLIQAQKDLRINTASEVMPNKIADNIQLTYELKPSIVSKYLAAINSTGGTIIPAQDQEVYIVAIQLNVDKDVTATSSSTHVDATIGGVVQRLNNINTTTLTVQNITSNITIGMPGLKIDRNTAVTLVNQAATANITSTATVYYYVMSK